MRRWPRISASSRTPPREKRRKGRFRARAMDRAREVLPTPGRAHQAEDGAAQGRAALSPGPSLAGSSQPAHDRQVLQDPGLDLFQTGVVLVQDPLGLLQVQVLVGDRPSRAGPAASRCSCGTTVDSALWGAMPSRRSSSSRAFFSASSLISGLEDLLPQAADLVLLAPGAPRAGCRPSSRPARTAWVPVATLAGSCSSLPLHPVPGRVQLQQLQQGVQPRLDLQLVQHLLLLPHLRRQGAGHGVDGARPGAAPAAGPRARGAGQVRVAAPGAPPPPGGRWAAGPFSAGRARPGWSTSAWTTSPSSR